MDHHYQLILKPELWTTSSSNTMIPVEFPSNKLNYLNLEPFENYLRDILGDNGFLMVSYHLEGNDLEVELKPTGSVLFQTPGQVIDHFIDEVFGEPRHESWLGNLGDLEVITKSDWVDYSLKSAAVMML